MSSSTNNPDAVQSAISMNLPSRPDWQLTMTITPEKSEDCYAITATVVSSDGTETSASYSDLPLISAEALVGMCLNEFVRSSESQNVEA